MASVVPRKDKHGEICSYQVKWRLGGKATGAWQIERFADPDDMPKAEASAKVFKAAVDAAKQQWPPGWRKGKGYIAAGSGEESRFGFEAYARASIANRTAGAYYKTQRIRMLEMYIFPTFGTCDVRSAEHFSKATIGAWVNEMRVTQVRRGGGELKDMSNGTLRGLLKLLSSVLEEAVVADPPLRDRNPCRLIRLGNGHSSADDSGDLMEFLNPDEVKGLVSCFPRASDRMLVWLAFGTGLRWGEITALEGQHIRDPRPGEYEVRVVQAWKRRTPTDFRLGPPKSEAGVRTIEIHAGLWQDLQDFGLAELDVETLVFRGLDGGRIKYGSFWERWNRAVRKAKKLKLLPAWRMPTFHDLRHSHVAVLLSETPSLLYVQRRLGHESMQTTADRYGHLLETAHKAALVALDRAMGSRGGSLGEGPGDVAPAAPVAPVAPAAPAMTVAAAVVAPIPAQRAGRPVYVASLGGRLVPFWAEEDAERTAERWVRERGGSVQVEQATSEEWAGEPVRTQAARRAWVWEVGPVVYAGDGSEVVVEPRAGEVRGMWRWDFEPEYTEDQARFAVEQWGEPDVRTAVRAWGRDEQRVLALFAEARTDALRSCGPPLTGWPVESAG
ncbi:tyrosine-type recombinase/integrase [Streptomyces vinaceus]|uniref:tyrosine-type recombinase/integrase n=1 Tax=Streptomyces vinaceus TaxID=1960 RepID=UPI00368A1AEE